MSEATSHSAHWVTGDAEIATLAAQVTDPAREKLIVCVTTQPSLERPFVDPDVLAERLGERADVWAITSSDHAWALTEALPDKIDVYGGAVRAWTPIPAGKDIYPSDHPQWTVFSAGDAPKVTEAVVEYAALAENPPPDFGSETTATVTALRKAGAELELESGHPAFASNQHLVLTGEVYHSREILQVGQQVQVRVGPWHPQAMRVSVSLRDFAPDPWERLEEQYRIGAVVEAVVSTIQPYGAFVELLPGAEGLLHKSKIADEFVHDIEDYVRPGDRIAVRLKTLDGYAHKAEVTMIDVLPSDAPEPLASVYPGGPAWLPDSPDGFGDDEPEAGQGAGAVPTWEAAAGRDATGAASQAAALQARVEQLEARLAEVTRERDALRGDVTEPDEPEAPEAQAEPAASAEPEASAEPAAPADAPAERPAADAPAPDSLFADDPAVAGEPSSEPTE